MKKFYLLLLVATASFGLLSCTDELTDRVDKLENRVDALETLTQRMNESLSGLQSIVDAIDAGDYIVSVTAVENGYKLVFAKAGEKFIYNGQDGKTPLLSVVQGNGDYYWTVDGKALLDASGNKIRVNGHDAVAPQVRIDATSSVWEVSTDGGQNWTSTGVKATGDDGDTLFADIDLTNSSYVTFTLNDTAGTRFKVARSSAKYLMTIHHNPRYASLWNGNTFTFPSCEQFEFSVSLSTVDGQYIPAADYGGIKVRIESRSTTATEVTTETRGANYAQWNLVVNGPISYDDGTVDIASADVTPPAGVESETAVLTFTFYDNQGESVSASCILRYDFPQVELTEPGTLASVIETRDLSMATSLRIKGPMDQRDFATLKTMTVLTSLDLSDVTVRAYGDYPANTIPEAALGGWAEDFDHNLRTVVLPRSATAIGNSAFALCTNLMYVHFPEDSRMKTLGRWIFQYSGLVQIRIPASVTTLAQSAFYGTLNLEEVSFEKGSALTEIPYYCFQNSRIKSISLPESVTRIASWSFSYDPRRGMESQLAQIDAPGVKTVEYGAFAECRQLKTLKMDAKSVSFDTDALIAYDFDTNSAGESLTPGCDLYVDLSTVPATGNVWNNLSWKSVGAY